MNSTELKALIINELDSEKAAELGECWGQSAFATLDEKGDFRLLKSRLESEKLAKKGSGNVVPLQPRRSHFWKFAAAAAAVFAGIFFVGKSWDSPAPSFKILETASGETRQFDLPDGSKVWLNKNSSLKFLADFSGEKRAVALVGEAFFEVKKDASKPFIVSTPDGAAIKVLGTRFDVKSEKPAPHGSSGGQSTAVFVEEGRVELSGAGQKIELGAGEFAQFSIEKALIERAEKAPSQNLTAWKSRQLVFENASLEEVARDFEHLFGIQIDFEKACLKSRRFTSPQPISTRDPLAAMQLFAATVGATVQLDGQKATIRGGDCR